MSPLPHLHQPAGRRLAHSLSARSLAASLLLALSATNGVAQTPYKVVAPDGKVTYEKEMKGLDLVRRDWCGISKETGTFVVEQILSGKPREEIVQAIHDYLTDLSTKIRAGQMPLEGFIVTKGLNKNPKDYPDCKGQVRCVDMSSFGAIISSLLNSKRSPNAWI